MRYDHPNHPERLDDLSGRDYHEREEQRSGAAARDGYSLIARKPRGGIVSDTIDPEAADRIESMFTDLKE